MTYNVFGEMLNLTQPLLELWPGIRFIIPFWLLCNLRWCMHCDTQKL